MVKAQRISWEQYFIAQARLVSLRSTCTRLMVGAVIVRENRIIASGYNGSVADGDHCVEEGCYMVDGHCLRTVHAEANALLQCAKFGVATNNTAIYCTHFPCIQCTKQLIQAGVSQLFYEDDYHNHDLAVQLLEEAGIEIKQVKLEQIAVSNLLD